MCSLPDQVSSSPSGGQRSESMADGAICPKCGGAVRGDAPQGLCPACMMAFALNHEPADPSTGGPGDPSRQDPSHAGGETIATIQMEPFLYRFDQVARPMGFDRT